MAVRAALGASQWEVARPIIAETLILSFAGGVLGLIARVRRAATDREPARRRLPRMDAIRSMAACWRSRSSSRSASRWRLDCCRRCTRRKRIRATTCRSRSGSTTSPYARRLLSGLVVIEVALALVLLVGAGLMTRSFTKLLQVNPGFDPST